MDRAACRPHAQLFRYVLDSGSKKSSLARAVYNQSIEEARLVCATCSEIAECRRFAAQYPEDPGFYHGLTHKERRKL